MPETLKLWYFPADLKVRGLPRTPKADQHTMTRTLQHRSLLPILTLLSALALPSPAVSEPTGTEPAPPKVEQYEDALSKFEAGEFRDAVTVLQAVVEANPKHLPARILLGRAYLKNGEAALAEQELLMAIGLGADRDIADVYLAESYFQGGKIDQLLERVRPGAHGSQAAGEIALIHAQALLQRRKFEDTESMLDIAARYGVDPKRMLVIRAQILLTQGEFDGAQALVDEAVANDPEDAEAWFYTGRLAEARGDVKAALQAQTRAIEASPDYHTARFRRALYLVVLGRDAEATADIDYILAKSPYHPMGLYLHGILLARKGDLDGARDALQRAEATLAGAPGDTLANNPQLLLLASGAAYDLGNYEQAASYLAQYQANYATNFGVLRRLAAIQLAQGKPDQALDTLKPLLTKDQREPAILALAGEAYSAKREFDTATRFFERALAATPADPKLKLGLVRSRLQSGHADDALDLLEDLNASGTLKPRGTLLLGMLYLRQEEPARTKEVAQRILEGDPDSLIALNLLGAAQLALGERDKARASLEKALAVAPDYLPAQINLGLLDARDGHPELARERFDALLLKDSGQAAVLQAYADLEQGQGQPEQAIFWLEKLRASHPLPVSRTIKLIDLYLTTGKAPKALDVAYDLQTRNPGSFPALLAVATCELAVGKPKLALVTLQRLAKDVSYDAEKLYPVARLQWRAGAANAAYWSLLKAVEGDPAMLKGQVALARMELVLNKPDDALTRSALIQARLPDRDIGYLLEGDARMARGEPRPAVAAYRRALEVEPSNTARFKVYAATKRVGDGAAALKQLQTWLAERPDNPELERFLAGVLVSAGKLDQARGHYEHLLEGKPNDLVTLNNLAMIYQTQGDPRALETARRAYELAPTHPDVLDTLGWSLVEGGDPAAGLRYLRDAQSRQADLPGLSYHLAVGLYKTGRHDQAVRELQTVLASGASGEEKKRAQDLLDVIQAGRAAGKATVN